MGKTSVRPGGKAANGRSRQVAAKARTVALSAAALVPLLTTTVAHQDMTSLIEGERAAGRWQAFFVPSPAGSIEKATLGFAKGTTRQMPDGAGVSGGDGRLYTMTGGPTSLETPDEARINRREKTGRVLATTPFLPPKAFSAGSILQRQSLLRPTLAEDGAVQTAFLKRRSTEDPIQVAMNLEPARSIVPVPEPAPAVMVASLSPKAPKPAPAAAETTALGYAPTESARNPAETLFGRILRGAGRGAGTGFIPPIGRKDHAWAATPLPADAYSAKEQLCLANGIYFEARGESERGQAAVAQVILNRVRNPTYPKTICGVVYQNQDWRNRCQFSFACDGIRKRVTNKRAFSTAMRIAGEVTRGETWLADVGSATHYHATYVRPRWASAMQRVDKIGRHIFYRTYNGGWN